MTKEEKKVRYKALIADLIVALILALLALAVYGWFMNAKAIWHAEVFNGAVLLRVLGLLFPPLGAVLGWI